MLYRQFWKYHHLTLYWYNFLKFTLPISEVSAFLPPPAHATRALKSFQERVHTLLFEILLQSSYGLKLFPDLHILIFKEVSIFVGENYLSLS
jgi:hypothetical protein